MIFDVDGTLVDSEGLSNQAFLDLIPACTDPLHVLIDRNRGRRFVVVAQELAAQAGVALPEDFEAAYRARVDELLEAHLKPIAGVKDMLSALRLPFCAASNAPHRKIRKAMQRTHLEHFFGERIYSAYDVNAWKPAPDLFLHAAKSMGYPPSRCVVIEDSEVGLQAAIAASMSVLFFSPANTEHLSQPTATFTDMNELLPLLEQQRKLRATNG